MEWISGWIEGIIVTVIIGTVIEMLLPEGNSKKYIKVVIGVYIIFNIIWPVINKVSKKDIQLSNIFDLDEYIEASDENTYNDLNNQQEKQILNIYQSSLESDMKQKIKARGYEVLNIELEIENNKEYKIKSINLTLKKEVADKTDNTQYTNENVNSIQSINEVKIQISDAKAKNEQKQNIKEENNGEENISDKSLQELKQYLGSVYEVEQNNINIHI